MDPLLTAKMNFRAAVMILILYDMGMRRQAGVTPIMCRAAWLCSQYGRATGSQRVVLCGCDNPGTARRRMNDGPGMTGCGVNKQLSSVRQGGAAVLPVRQDIASASGG